MFNMHSVDDHSDFFSDRVLPILISILVTVLVGAFVFGAATAISSNNKLKMFECEISDDHVLCVERWVPRDSLNLSSSSSDQQRITL